MIVTSESTKIIILLRREHLFSHKSSLYLSESTTFDSGFWKPFILLKREQRFAKVRSFYLGESITFGENHSFYFSGSTTFVLAMWQVPRWSPGKRNFTCARAAVDSETFILPQCEHTF